MDFYFECEQTIINSCDGSVTTNVSGGVAPYTYAWSNGETTASLNNTCVGNYSVTITDANGCSVVTDSDVDCDPNGANATNSNSSNRSTNNENAIETRLYPNPTSGRFTFEITTLVESDYSIVIYDMAGNVIEVLFDGHMDENELKYVTYESGNISRGIYTIAVTSNGNVTYEKLVVQ
jgi:hypothetical protein